MSTSRRSFLKQSSLIAAGTALAPYFINGMTSPFHDFSGKRLVIIQLSGGNDGLNTVVPYGNDIYYRERPQIAIQPDQVLKLNDELGFHPALTGLRSLYDEGLLGIINSVGYPNPDRSHFRSMDIWHTGSNSEENWTTGWLGRYLDHACEQCEAPYQAIEVDDSLSLAMKGKRSKGMAMSAPDRLTNNIKGTHAEALAKMHGDKKHDNHQLGYLYKTMVETVNSADYISEKIKKYRSRANYPQNPFAANLKTIAELIGSGMETSVYYASMTGFDTHARQTVTQQRLLRQYSDSVSVFVRDLKESGELKNTVILTFSEFGRRVGQNASGGTDHGTANNLFVMGGSTKPGFFNQAPQLIDLDNGDLKFEIDFRRIYATLLDDWLGASSKAVLQRDFKSLNFI